MASRRSTPRLPAPGGELRTTPGDVHARLGASSIHYSHSTQRVQSHCSLKAAWSFSLLTIVERIRARYCSNAAVFCRVSRRQKFATTPRTRASSDRRRRGRTVSAGNRYRQCQTSADVVTRESRCRSSGRRPSSQPATGVRGFNVASGAS